MPVKTSSPLFVVTLLIICIQPPDRIAYGQSGREGKAINAVLRAEFSPESPATEAVTSSAISDHDFKENARETFKAFNYVPADENDWAKTISMAFSGNGRYLCIGEDNSESRGSALVGRTWDGNRKELAVSRLWDLQTGTEVRRFAGHQKHLYIQSVSFSGDANVVSTTAFHPYSRRASPFFRIPDGEDVRLWDTQTGEQLYHWENAGVMSAVSPNGDVVAVAGTNHLSLFATSGKSETAIWRLPLDCYIYAKPIFARQGRTILVSVGDGIAEVETASGKLLRIIGQKVHNGTVKKFAHNPQGQLLASVRRNSVIVWDFEKGVEIRRLPITRNNGDVETLCFSQDDAVLKVITDHGYLLEWDIRSGAHRRGAYAPTELHLRAAAISPNGKLAALAARDQGTVDLLNLDTGEYLVRLHNLHSERRWFVETPDGALNGPEDILRIEQLALEDMKLRIDPMATGTACRNALRLGAARKTAEGEMQSGRRLYVLAVGVSKHKYSKHNLRFAAQDANRLTQVLQASPSDLFADVIVQTITDEEADKDNIQAGLDWLVRSCTKDDVAVIHFSGHGVRGRNGLYFVPYEGDEQSIQSTCLNWTEIADRVAKINAEQILFFADCCHAGAFSKENRPTQDEIAKALQKKSGLLLFCSSRGEELSLELASERHGAFTGSIVESFQGAGDTNGDRRITTGELVDYVSRRVGELTQGKQQPSLPYPDQFDRRIEIGSVPSDR